MSDVLTIPNYDNRLVACLKILKEPPYYLVSLDYNLHNSRQRVNYHNKQLVYFNETVGYARMVKYVYDKLISMNKKNVANRFIFFKKEVKKRRFVLTKKEKAKHQKTINYLNHELGGVNICNISFFIEYEFLNVYFKPSIINIIQKYDLLNKNDINLLINFVSKKTDSSTVNDEKEDNKDWYDYEAKRLSSMPEDYLLRGLENE